MIPKRDAATRKAAAKHISGVTCEADSSFSDAHIKQSETAQPGEKPFGDVPYGYTCCPSGVSVDRDDKEPEQITHKPVWVSALSRDGSCDNWGRLVQWADADSNPHTRAMPAAMFHANGNELAQEMATLGLPIVPGKERKLLQYLAAFTPDTRLTAATVTGWLGDAFVMPDKTINEPDNERIIYQSNEYRATDCMGSSGTVKSWQEMVLNVSPLVKFGIACSLAAPLQMLTNTAAGGVNFYGRTSHGKTTVLQVACSVWGNAADPALAGGADVYIQRWNATKNGLEGMAASFNDLPLIIDEIGENDGREFGKIVYQLMSGTGKQRANRTGGMSKRRAWRIMLLSSGELPVSDFIENAKGGQLVRLIDIEAVDLFKDRIDADAMKHGCAQNYGTAGVAFLQSGDLLEGFSELQADDIGDAPTAEAGRVRDRFRLVAHAGELAIRRGILPWDQGDVLAACQSVYSKWKANGNGMSEADRGIENVRNFLMAFGSSRFEHDDDYRREPIDRAGWFRNDIYHFTDAAFKEACAGVLPDVVRKSLKRKNLLHLSDAKRLKAQIKVGGKPVRVTSIKSDIVSSNENAPEAAGTVVTGQGAQGFAEYPLEETERLRPEAQSVTASTASTCENGAVTAETVAGQGLSPSLPPLPPENAKSEKVSGGDPFDDFPEEVAGGLRI